MEKLLELGQCLLVLIGAPTVAWGIWRAWTRKPAEAGSPPPPPPAAPAAPRWSLRDELRGIFLTETVKDYVAVAPGPPAPAGRTDRTNDRTNERSAHDSLWQEFLLDRTRARLIAVMVDSGMTVTEIRELLKGESKAIGLEVEQAREQLGLPATGPYKTPVADRPTDARFPGDPTANGHARA